MGLQLHSSRAGDATHSHRRVRRKRAQLCHAGHASLASCMHDIGRWGLGARTSRRRTVAGGRLNRCSGVKSGLTGMRAMGPGVTVAIIAHRLPFDAAAAPRLAEWVTRYLAIGTA